MDACRKLWEALRPHQKFGAPALPQMRLGPEDSPSPPCMVQFFTWDSGLSNPSWWKHFEHQIPDLHDLGFTQVWLPPPNKAMAKDGRGYDAYDLWDLGEFDQKGSVGTRWGTKDELLKAADTAKAYGLDILIDAVLNHKIGADNPERFHAVPVNPENRLEDIGPPQEIDGWTAFRFPGRGNIYSSFKWKYEHFTGIDWDDRTKTQGVYRIAGKSWSKRVDEELGNYDYLLGVDIDHQHLGVIRDLLSWGPWVLEIVGATGFRFDAIKHIDHKFLCRFIRHCRRDPKRSRMFAVAEYWSANINLVLPYIRTFQGLTSFFDVPLHDNFHQASKQGSQYDLRKILDNSIIKLRPGDAVTFVDNHDTQIGQSLESWVYSSFKLQAYALILLRSDGHPCVFYGDLYPNEECYDATVAHGLRLLLRCRRSAPYFSGSTVDYWDNQNCVGWVREGQRQQNKRCAVLISNAHEDETKGSHAIRMFIGEQAVRYKNLFGPNEEVIQIDQAGWGSFICRPGKVAVWVPLDFIFTTDSS